MQRGTKVQFTNWLGEAVEGTLTDIAPDWSFSAGTVTVVGENGPHAGLIYRGVPSEDVKEA